MASRADWTCATRWSKLICTSISVSMRSFYFKHSHNASSCGYVERIWSEMLVCKILPLDPLHGFRDDSAICRTLGLVSCAQGWCCLFNRSSCLALGWLRWSLSNLTRQWKSMSSFCSVFRRGVPCSQQSGRTCAPCPGPRQSAHAGCKRYGGHQKLRVPGRCWERSQLDLQDPQWTSCRT